MDRYQETSRLDRLRSGPEEKDRMPLPSFPVSNRLDYHLRHLRNLQLVELLSGDHNRVLARHGHHAEVMVPKGVLNPRHLQR